MENLYSIHILTTHKHKDRHSNIVNSWLKNRNNYVFYTDVATNVGNQVSVSLDDTYFSNGKKNLAELHRIYNLRLHDKVDWLLFCDDDTVVNLKKLESLLPNLNKEKTYGFVLNGTWPDDRSLSYLSGGAGYLLSSKLLSEKKPPSLNYLNFSFYSDVCMGLWYRDNNIKFENIEGFHSQSADFYYYQEEQINNSITFHYIKTKDQLDYILSIWESNKKL